MNLQLLFCPSQGGAFGKMEVAHEEEYFYKQRQEQLKALKKQMINEKTFHEESIKQHEAAIKRHKEVIKECEQQITSNF